MSDQINIQQKTIRVKPIDQNAPGFLPLYRSLLATQRALTNPAKAIPEDIDGAYEVLSEHFIEPKNPAEIKKVLDGASAEDIMNLFGVLMGTNTVPPVKDVA